MQLKFDSQVYFVFQQQFVHLSLQTHVTPMFHLQCCSLNLQDFCYSRTMNNMKNVPVPSGKLDNCDFFCFVLDLDNLGGCNN